MKTIRQLKRPVVSYFENLFSQEKTGANIKSQTTTTTNAERSISGDWWTFLTDLKSCKPHEPVQPVVIRWNNTWTPLGVSRFTFKLIFFPDATIFIWYNGRVSGSLKYHFSPFFCYARKSTQNLSDFKKACVQCRPMQSCNKLEDLFKKAFFRWGHDCFNHFNQCQVTFDSFYNLSIILEQLNVQQIQRKIKTHILRRIKFEAVTTVRSEN